MLLNESPIKEEYLTAKRKQKNYVIVKNIIFHIENEDHEENLEKDIEI